MLMRLNLSGFGWRLRRRRLASDKRMTAAPPLPAGPFRLWRWSCRRLGFAAGRLPLGALQQWVAVVADQVIATWRGRLGQRLLASRAALVGGKPLVNAARVIPNKAA